MKHFMKYGFGCLVAIVSTMAMSSCEDDDEMSDLTAAVVPSSVELVLPEEVQQLVYKDEETGADVLPMLKGETVQLAYVLTPENVTFPDVVWTSTNPGVATVENGLVTAVEGNGLTSSVVQVAPEGVHSGSGIFANIRVVVSNTMVQAESIRIESESDELYASETLQLTAKILPENATYKTVSWSSSDEGIATVDENGLVTGVVNDDIQATVTITATSLDGSQVYGTKELTVNQMVEPEKVTIGQAYSVDNGYYCAIADKALTLDYTTVPAQCTTSLIEWTSSNEEIATVADGVVTFNQNGVFGDVTITASCPATGESSSVKLNLAAGLIRELFHNENNVTWGANTQYAASEYNWEEGYMAIVPNSASAKQRADFKALTSKTWLHAGNYPVVAVRMEDVRDRDEVTGCNINLDTSGSCDGNKYSGNVGGSNNKWAHDYKCSDGSHVFIYDLSTQNFATGGLLPTSSVAEFTTFQFKYADIATTNPSEKVIFNVYWVQTFKTVKDVQNYIEDVDDLTFEVIK